MILLVCPTLPGVNNDVPRKCTYKQLRCRLAHRQGPPIKVGHSVIRPMTRFPTLCKLGLVYPSVDAVTKNLTYLYAILPLVNLHRIVAYSQFTVKVIRQVGESN